jgi:hypothetical protein
LDWKEMQQVIGQANFQDIINNVPCSVNSI